MRKAASDVDNYCHALGVFIMMFASTQRSLFAFLETISGAPVTSARVSFGEVDVQGAMDKINQITRLRMRCEQDILELNRCFNQLQRINEVRSLIVAHGIEADEPDMNPGPSSFIVSNRFTEIDQEKIKIFPISELILGRMTNDVGQIGIIISILSAKHRGHPLPTAISEVRMDWEWTANFAPGPAD